MKGCGQGPRFVYLCYVCGITNIYQNKNGTHKAFNGNTTMIVSV